LGALPDGAFVTWAAGGGAGRVSPIFGLGGKVGRLAPVAIEALGSELRARSAASGEPDARSGTSGTDAGRPVVGSDIGEIPSPGRVVERRGWQPSGGNGGNGPSDALGMGAEIESKNTFHVVSFATSGARSFPGAVGDDEEDEAGDDARSSRKRHCQRGPRRRHPDQQSSPLAGPT
jgi:hypothetical protein